MSESQFAMVSKWMPNGNINEFLTVRQDVNRFELVSSLGADLCRFRLVSYRVCFAARRRNKGLGLYARAGNGPRGSERGTFSGTLFTHCI